MSDPKVKRTGILPSDIDAAGNVTLWDHGPVELKPVPHESDETKAARQQKRAAEIHEWHEANGDGPVAVVMYSSDAGHALMIDPDRYALEPDEVDEGEVKKRMDEMKAKRLAAENYTQDVIDRRVAIASIVSDKAQAKSVSEEKPAPDRKAIGIDFGRPSAPPPAPKPEPAKDLT